MSVNRKIWLGFATAALVAILAPTVRAEEIPGERIDVLVVDRVHGHNVYSINGEPPSSLPAIDLLGKALEKHPISYRDNPGPLLYVLATREISIWGLESMRGLATKIGYRDAELFVFGETHEAVYAYRPGIVVEASSPAGEQLMGVLRKWDKVQKKAAK
jgi:hypothetical protein